MISFTADHEWLDDSYDDGVAVGITEHAASELGDIVYVELPEVGTTLAQGDEAVVIDSVKAASGIAAPIAGTVVAVNEAVAEDPASVNADPMGAWFFRLDPADPADLDGLMDEAAYRATLS